MAPSTNPEMLQRPSRRLSIEGWRLLSVLLWTPARAEILPRESGLPDFVSSITSDCESGSTARRRYVNEEDDPCGHDAHARFDGRAASRGKSGFDRYREARLLAPRRASGLRPPSGGRAAARRGLPGIPGLLLRSAGQALLEALEALAQGSL